MVLILYFTDLQKGFDQVLSPERQKEKIMNKGLVSFLSQGYSLELRDKTVLGEFQAFASPVSGVQGGKENCAHSN